MLEVSGGEIRYFKQLDERQQRLYVGLKLKKIYVNLFFLIILLLNGTILSKVKLDHVIFYSLLSILTIF
jgi:hypothetical protein